MKRGDLSETDVHWFVLMQNSIKSGMFLLSILKLGKDKHGDIRCLKKLFHVATNCESYFVSGDSGQISDKQLAKTKYYFKSHYHIKVHD